MNARAIATSLLAGAVCLLAGCSGSATPDADTRDTGPEATPGAVLVLASPAFEDGAPIPAEHAKEPAGGRNVSVPLEWSGVPDGTESLALEVVDLHPAADEWVHWLVVDLPADVSGLPAGASGADMPAGCRELVNSFGTSGWGGPQPPAGTGAHEYRFTIRALDVATLGLAENASLDEFRASIAGHSLASATLSGTFER